ncbi:hypothetical protein BH09PSE4_BH09PSE4_20520 [soil metagenome]
MPTDPRVDAYIAKQADFARPILEHLRARVHAVCPEVDETIKWSRPFFEYRGRQLGIMSGFKAHASFGFWQRDAVPTGKEGEAMGQFGRLTSIADLPDDAVFDALVRDAIAAGEANKPKRPARVAKPEAEVPTELAKALAGDAAATKTFTEFPPSCRREYCEWVAEAKRPETREKRIAETIAALREGKRRNWKYEAC